MTAVRLQSVCLDQPESAFARFLRLLSRDELARASRFVFDRDRRRFVVCRGALRESLGRLLGREPASIVFEYGERGKPSLPDANLHFNVSHSAGLALFAFSTTGPIGVDVEHVERSVDAEALATRFFSPDEAQELLTVTPNQRRRAFFNCWTRKESFIKAIGDGLSRPLDSFSVTLRPGDPATMRRIDGDDAAEWQLAAFEPAHGYVAAVAARQRRPLTFSHDWDQRTPDAKRSDAFDPSRPTRGLR